MSADPRTARTARIAGLMFLLSLLVPALGWIGALSRLVVPGDAVETARNVTAHPLLFRVGIVSELATSAVVLALAAALYALLEPFGRHLASLALFAKIVEAGLWAVIALGHVAAVTALEGRASAPVPGQVERLVGSLLGAHMPVTAVPGVFLGLDLVLFLWLLFRSRYVPGALAGFGVIAYALVFAYDASMILAPDQAARLEAQLGGWGPSVLFEVVIGPWLLVRGVRVPEGPRATA